MNLECTMVWPLQYGFVSWAEGSDPGTARTGVWFPNYSSTEWPNSSKASVICRFESNATGRGKRGILVPASRILCFLCNFKGILYICWSVPKLISIHFNTLLTVPSHRKSFFSWTQQMNIISQMICSAVECNRVLTLAHLLTCISLQVGGWY